MSLDTSKHRLEIFNQIFFLKLLFCSIVMMSEPHTVASYCCPLHSKNIYAADEQLFHPASTCHFLIISTTYQRHITLKTIFFPFMHASESHVNFEKLTVASWWWGRAEHKYKKNHHQIHKTTKGLEIFRDIFSRALMLEFGYWFHIFHRIPRTN